MATLLLRLEGPMQSWGTSSRFTERDTGREPTKSGVIGMIAAALGRPRTSPIADLTALKMGVRVEREGVIRRDYQTAENVPKANRNSPETSVSNRYYLADARFLVGLEGDEVLLKSISNALQNPVWPIYLGRKAFVPSSPLVIDGLRDEPLEVALRNHPWLSREGEEVPARLRLIVECNANEGVERMDVPLSFSDRMFSPRFVKSEYLDTPGGTM